VPYLNTIVLSVLTAIFPGEPGLAGFTKAEHDNLLTTGAISSANCKAPVKSSPPTNQRPTFYRPDALPVAQSTVSKKTLDATSA